MSNPKKVCIGIAVAALLCFITVVALHKPGQHPKARVVIDSAGNTRVFGIPVGNSAARDTALNTIVALGYTNGVAVSLGQPANATEESNLINSLNRAVRAGVIRPAANTPSPYE